MRAARVYVHEIEAGLLEERSDTHYVFTYKPDYVGPPVSLFTY